MATFPWTRQHQAQGAAVDNLPNFKRWFEDISARPAVKTMIAKQGEIKSSRETASDDHKDRFFGCGQIRLGLNVVSCGGGRCEQ